MGSRIVERFIVERRHSRHPVVLDWMLIVLIRINKSHVILPSCLMSEAVDLTGI